MTSNSWRFGLMLGLAVLGGLSVPGAPTPVYENTGVANQPVIDAVTFLNRGVFNVSAPDVPYDTQNTLYFTNFPGASIVGNGGVRFGLVREDGFRYPAESFHNSGIIRLESGGFGGFIIGGGLGIIGLYPNSWVLIDATNVVNRGGLGVGPSGLIHIEGDNVQLQRSGLRAGEDPTTPIAPGGTFPPFYSNDAGVQDLYAGVGQNNSLDPAAQGPFNLAVLAGSPPNSGSHEVLLPSGVTNNVRVSAPHGFARTNTVSETNWVVQVVLIDTNSIDPFFRTAVRWASPRMGDVPGGSMAMVQFTFEDVDTITGEPFTNYVYVLDHLGTLTNAVFLTNSFNAVNQRPSSLEITRITPPEWESGVETNAIFGPDLIVNPTYLATEVTNVYAAYSVNIAPDPRVTPGGTPVQTGPGPFGQASSIFHPTNQPGRIEIAAGSLDIGLTRFRSEGLLSIQADELNPAAPQKLDSPIVRLNVARSEGPLIISNIVETTVRRFSGSVSCWSAVWTNQTFTTAPDPNDPALTVTNTIDIRFHALIVSRNFETIVPVETLSFAGRAAEAHVWDELTLRETFVLDAPIVGIHAPINLRTNEITPAMFPSLEELTLEGELRSLRGVQFGTPDNPIHSISNSGAISGSTIYIEATQLENVGALQSFAGDVILNNRDLKLEGGSIVAAANLRITADDFKAQMSTINIGTESFGALVFDVRNRLTDNGGVASNSWVVTDGFQLLQRPAEGDLSGSEITSFLNRFREGIHLWSAADLGPTAAGFENNMALGRLTLDGTPLTLFTFVGPDTVNPYALYVDFLNLTNSATDIALHLNIATNFTIYFADASVPPEELDGALDGRLRWVPDRAGAFSGVEVPLASGGTARVNRAVLASTRIDSDGDGIPNAEDPTPFESPSSSALRVNVRLLNDGGPQAEVSWTGTPGRQYRVEYSTSLAGGEWKTLTSCEHTEATPGTVKVCDTNIAPSEQRFYRVVEVR